MGAKDGLFQVIDLPKDCQQYQSEIPGLGFEPNYLFHDHGRGLSPETTVYSNSGYVVGHFVTHSTSFAYTTFGIHVGQKDQLTFYSSSPKTLVGYFVDCRCGSPFLGRRVAFKFDTSPTRKLIIPCGVAHTFSNLETVVTRNDLVLYADANNPSWYPVNDDLVFPWTRKGITTAPAVEVNTAEIPLAATTLFYRVQQEALRKGHLTAQKKAIVCLPEFDAQLNGCEFELNSFKEIAKDSWMVIPNTASCVMDLVIMQLDSSKHRSYATHDHQTVLHTFLDREGSEVEIQLVDLRADSPTFKATTRCAFKCDARFHLRIPAGVVYRYRGSGAHAVRIEYEMSPSSKRDLKQLVKLGTGRTRFLTRDLGRFSGILTKGSELAAATQQELFQSKLKLSKRVVGK